jgi:5-methylcytosine-specific restriction enzyme subunit McrC
LAEKNPPITVFEHEVIRFDKGEKRITEDQFLALQKYYGDKGVPYFKLVCNGVQFNEYVGVIQIGNTLIEVLPKADNLADSVSVEKKWRNILIGMLRTVGSFDIKATSYSNLKIRPNTILDLYFELFISEVEYLVHNGLLKQYRKTEGNVTALKGSLQFGKHLQNNLTHQERFFVKYTTYDALHKIHFILYKAIKLIRLLNTNANLHSRIGALFLYFPEMPDIKVSDTLFKKLVLNRKTQCYEKAIDIAKLILLQYHPDIIKGVNNVLALMFDMNKLWERFFYVTLYRNKKQDISINAQTTKYFWKPVTDGNRSKIIPDIVINDNQGNYFVLDTKWKNLGGYNPSPEDLRQMYVYHDYYKAIKVALVYPGSEINKISGYYLHPETSKELNKECSVITISVEPDLKKWQENIYNEFESWLKTT